ncbi:hypothetical protein KRM28CT15_31180 [Krasilnikovia sp. M28-CT-15]
MGADGNPEAGGNPGAGGSPKAAGAGAAGPPGGIGASAGMGSGNPWPVRSAAGRGGAGRAWAAAMSGGSACPGSPGVAGRPGMSKSATGSVVRGIVSPPGGMRGPAGPPRPCRAASTRPDDSASPAATRTSAAARPVEQGSGSPHTGQVVIPAVGPAPPACASITSAAVRARTLSGRMYAVDPVAMVVPRRSAARAGTRGQHKFTAPGAGLERFRAIGRPSADRGGEGRTPGRRWNGGGPVRRAQ